MIRLYNAISRQLEDFVPQDPKRVTMYVCGPTVYDSPHLGNARPAVVFDLLFRVLRNFYQRVDYARNITDIDDKIMDRAAQNGETIESLTARTTQQYRDAMRTLRVLPPTFEPRATQTIPEIQAMVRQLIGRGHAYAVDGHVYFSVASNPAHGKLSNHDQANLRIAVRDIKAQDAKRDPADFVLWKPSTDDQPGWESPWGRGRPGWHIECSAMVKAILGPTIDLHGGGADLRFPHHDCEISQSECANDAPLARYWLHNGLLTVDGKKMAKRSGNFFTVQDLLSEGWTGDEIRLAILQTHYRSPLDWTSESLQQARVALIKWRDALLPYRSEMVALAVAGDGTNPVLAALDNDLNVPQAMAIMHAFAQRLNSRSADAGSVSRKLAYALYTLGLLEDFLRDRLSKNERDLLQQRESARVNKDYDVADALRNALAESGINVKDTPHGCVWWR